MGVAILKLNWVGGGQYKLIEEYADCVERGSRMNIINFY
jgi:hypothetical protein